MRGQDLSKGATLCQSEGTYQIVMLTSTPVVGCLLEKGLQRWREGGRGGGGVKGTPGPSYVAMPTSYTHQIVMATSTPVVGCLLEKGSQKMEGGGGGSRAPQVPPMLLCPYSTQGK